jgi:hypothetical protein
MTLRRPLACITGKLGEELDTAVGTHVFPIRGRKPMPVLCNLPIGPTLCYLLDAKQMEPGMLERLVEWIARRFGDDAETVRQELDQKGFPIRAEVCSVFFDGRALL